MARSYSNLPMRACVLMIAALFAALAIAVPVANAGGGKRLSTTTGGTSTATAAASTSTFFAPSSVWNAPLASNAALDPSSSARSAALLSEVRNEISLGTGPWINEKDYSTPLYTVSGTQAKVHVQLAPVRNHVRPGAALDHAHVDGDSRPHPVQVVEGHDGVGGLERCRTSSFWLDPRVGGATSDDDPKIGHALARRHDVAVLPGALQHEAGVHASGSLQDQRSGEGRPDLLVRVADVGHRAEGFEPTVLERVHRI